MDSKDPVCEMCINRSDSPSDVSDSGIGYRPARIATPIMRVKKIIIGDSWKMRKVDEVFVCSICKCDTS
jgi:hypothetical protein